MKDDPDKEPKREESSSVELTGEQRVTAIALAAGDLLKTAQDVFERRLEMQLDRIVLNDLQMAEVDRLIAKGAFTSEASFRKLLLKPLSVEIMFVIWRESDQVTAESLRAVGLSKRDASGKPMTRNALRNLVCSSRRGLGAAEIDAMKRVVERVCDAMEVLGLLEKEEVRVNFKPISGTPLLASLLQNAFVSVSDVFAAQLMSGD